MRVSGQENIPYNEQVIVISNHCSHLDLGLVKHDLADYAPNLAALAASDYFFDTPYKRDFSEPFTNLVAFDRDAGTAPHPRSEAARMLSWPCAKQDRADLPRRHALRRWPAQGVQARHRLPAEQDTSVDSAPLSAWHLQGHAQGLRRAHLPRHDAPTSAPRSTVDDLAQHTHGKNRIEAARTVARLAQRAVETLRDGGVLDLAHLDSAHEDGPRQHPMVTLFDDLQRRFRPGQVDDPVRFYFTLGNEPEAKWTVQVGPAECRIVNGKPEDGVADCVLKTSPDIFNRIVREGYQPGVAEFMSGAVKSNDVGLLQTFTRAFSLG